MHPHQVTLFPRTLVADHLLVPKVDHRRSQGGYLQLPQAAGRQSMHGVYSPKQSHRGTLQQQQDLLAQFRHGITEFHLLPLPAELEKSGSRKIKELEQVLERVATQLKKYSQVNKKAFDRNVNFNEQQESYIKQKDKLDHRAEKVKELLKSLNLKKDEAINRTCCCVSQHF